MSRSKLENKVIINYNILPKTIKHGKECFDYNKFNGLKIDFTYKNIKDFFTIDNVIRKGRSYQIILNYNNGSFITSIASFKSGTFYKSISRYTYKYNIGDVVGNNKILDRKCEKIIYTSQISYPRQYYCECIHCKHKSWKFEFTLNNNSQCAVCGKFPKTIKEGVNDIPTTAPWMVPYFQGGYDEAKRYTQCSHAKIYPICPYCGEIKKNKISISNIYCGNGISCVCSDSMSYPNKLMYNLLRIKNIEFISEYSPDWIKPKRYDFYIPSKTTKIERMVLMARPKLEQTQKAVSASTKINTKKNVSIDTNIKKETYKCWCCGNEYAKLQSNFTPTNFPLFKHYGYYPVCRKCTDKFYPEMISFFDGSEEKAIEFICMMYGLYFNESPLAASRKISEHRSRIHTYSSKVQIKPWIGLSWLDTLKERFEETDKPIENPDDIENTDQYKLTPKMIKFWGSGYEPKVYPTLQGYYDELLKLCAEKPDVKKQKMMKNLCLLEYQMQVNIQAGKDIGTLSNSYKAMFEAAELKVENADTSNDSFGKWIMDIEKYCPAEFYQDKKKYHDFFGIVEYIERFMFRPLRNLIFGEKEKEKEYWIDEDGD